MARRNVTGATQHAQVADEPESAASPPRTPSTKVIQTREMPPPTSLFRRFSTVLFGDGSPAKEALEPDTNGETAKAAEEEAFADVHEVPKSSPKPFNRQGPLPNSTAMASDPESSKATNNYSTTKASRSTTSPESQKGRKRKADVERPDLYDVDATLEDHETHSKDSTPRTKRRHPAPKAKDPIIQSKSSGRQTRSGAHKDEHAGSTNTELATEYVQPADIAGNSEQPKMKRRPGRPRKIPLQNDAAVTSPPHKNTSIASSSDNARNSSERQGVISVEIPIAPAHNFLDASEGDTSLYLNPSPIKAIPPKTPIPKSKSQPKKAPQERISPIPDLSDDSEEDARVEEDLEFDELGWLVKSESLLEMIVIASRVGKTKKRGENGEIAYEPVLQDEYTKVLHTRDGERMKRHLNNLLNAYKTFQRATPSEDGDALLLAKQDIDSILAALKGEVQSIMDSRLRNPEDETNDNTKLDAPKRTKTMLRDLYFHLIPDLLAVIRKSAVVNPLHRNTNTEALQEVLSLVELAYTLAGRALEIPDTHQPSSLIPKKIRRAGISSSFQTFALSKPIRSLVPKLLEVKKKIQEEINARQKRATQIEREKRYLASVAKRAEEERRQEIERERENKERRRRQRKAFQKYLNDPLYQVLFGGGNRTGSTPRRTASQSSSLDNGLRFEPHSKESDYRRRARENVGSEDYDPFDDDYERVSVFGSHNTKEVTHSKPWSDEERCTFVDYMRYDQSDDRYAKVADALDRSLDDVFEFAKDFQEAMDHENANQRLGRPCDEWTFSVWRGPR